MDIINQGASNDDIEEQLKKLKLIQAKLGNILFPNTIPIFKDLSISKIILAPYDKIQNLPLETIIANDPRFFNILSKNYELTRTISLSLFFEILLKNKGLTQKTINKRKALLVANPTEDLEKSVSEVMSIEKKIDDSFKVKKLIGIDADRMSVLQLLKYNLFNYIHFSGHGYFNGNIFDQHLILANDQPIGISELSSHDFKIPSNSIVFLSACDSGNADNSSDVEAWGLPTVFRIKGTGAVICTLYPVLDYASELLSIKFVDLWLSGLNSTNALIQAKDELIKLYPNDQLMKFTLEAFYHLGNPVGFDV